jgi:hypothetical protein
VSAGGSLTFTGLADDTAYVAAAQVSSVWRVRSLRSPTAPAVVSDSHSRVPSQNGLKAWTGNPELGNNANNLTVGRTHWVKCFCAESITFTTIWWHILAAGSTGTPLNLIFGAAAQDGTLLGRTSDQAAAGMSTTGEKSAALTAESGQVLAHAGGAGTYFWLGVRRWDGAYDAGDVHAPIGELDPPELRARDGGRREAVRLLDGERRNDARDVHAVDHAAGPRLGPRGQLGLAIHGRR